MRKGRRPHLLDPVDVDCLAPPIDISRLIVEDYFKAPNDTNLTMSTVDAASDVESHAVTIMLPPCIGMGSYSGHGSTREYPELGVGLSIVN